MGFGALGARFRDLGFRVFGALGLTSNQKGQSSQG